MLRKDLTGANMKKWKISSRKAKQRFRAYMLGTAAAAAVAFGLTVPVVMTAMGVTVDLAKVYMVRERLGRALDSSALAAAASTTNDEAVREQVENYFEVNFPAEKIGDAYDLVVDISGNEISVSASAHVETSFMRMMGYDYVDVHMETVVVREVQGLEVVMVLDNTGSMSENDNIGSLRTAATNFVNILFDSTSDASSIKVGLVPFSNSVNVGRYGLGKTPAGATYDGGYTFVRLPEGVDYTTSYTSSTHWYGCVLAFPTGTYSSSRIDNDPYPDDVQNTQGPWDAYLYENYVCSGAAPHRTCGYRLSSRPNRDCPETTVVPLTSNPSTLLSSIATMQAQGNTLGNFGMAWGYRLISPERPFTEGSPWGDNNWRKAVVMMTDGVNTMNREYSAYWRGRNHRIGTPGLNDRFEDVCATLKANNVTVYTVTFYSGVDDETKDIFRRCATDETKFFDAPSQEDLVLVFERISRELGNLHIRR